MGSTASRPPRGARGGSAQRSAASTRRAFIDHDFGAARDYLSLVYEPQTADRIAEELRNAPTIHIYKAKDILRASQLRPLGRKNFHVRADLDKIANEEKLSPVLLARDARRALLIIADGFHRVCASRIVDEDLVIPCRIITAP